MTDDAIRSDLTPEELGDLAALSNPSRAAEHARIRERVLANPRLAEALYSDLALETALRESARRTPLPARRSSPARIAWPLAAAAALALASTLLFQRESDEELRSGRMRSGTTNVSVRVLSPAGSVDAGPTRFLWSRDPRAVDYRVEIAGPAGALSFSETTADTFLTLDLLDLGLAGEHASWRVFPRYADREGPASPSVSLHVSSR
jgi:hypothetical protein